MLVSPFDLFSQAYDERYAVGAFNTSNVDVMRAIVAAAQKLRSPVIIETSEGERDFTGPEVFVAALEELAEEVAIPVVLHMDHGKTVDSIRTAINAGYTSVHFDGSSFPYQKNVELTQKVVALTEGKDISVEGEIEKIKGSSSVHSQDYPEKTGELTDPSQAREFVEKTGINCLAVSIGNVHGVYAVPPILDLARLAEINSTVDCFFSLHGGSGISESDIRGAIKNGIVKINVNTELRQAYVEGLRQELTENPTEVVPYKFLPEVLARVEEVVIKKIKLFGSEGKV